MPTTQDYAQMASRVYRRGDPNRTPTPSDWEEVSWIPDQPTGFSAGVYSRGSEIVIAYTGTNDAKVADTENSVLSQITKL
jgi:hypothetical protein